jgi:hypothetical protein
MCVRAALAGMEQYPQPPQVPWVFTSETVSLAGAIAISFSCGIACEPPSTAFICQHTYIMQYTNKHKPADVALQQRTAG